MKISNETPAAELRSEPSNARANGRNFEPSQAVSASDDSVELSDAGRLAAQLHDLSASRIEELRAKVASGNYSVDSSAVSGKIINSLLSD